MRTYPGLLTNAVRSALRSKHDLMLENLNLALRQQLAVLTPQRARTPTKPADRLFWSWLSRYWPGWRSTPVMVQPETVIRWHRTAWGGYWTWKSRARHPGRPRISKELQGLIARIATENPRRGAVRIQRELLALGYEVSAETVRCYRRRALRRPPSQSWRTFLANHRPQLRAEDCFTVQTLTIAPQPEPRPTYEVKTLPGRQSLRIDFPLIASYRFAQGSGNRRLDPGRVVPFALADAPTMAVMVGVAGTEDRSLALDSPEGRKPVQRMPSQRVDSKPGWTQWVSATVPRVYRLACRSRESCVAWSSTEQRYRRDRPG